MKRSATLTSISKSAFCASLASLALVAVASLVIASAALAARGHVFVSEFGGEGSGSGQLKDPYGLAVDESSHDLYVADYGNNRVQRFSYNIGTEKYEYASQITAATSSGTGTLTEGSKTVTSVSTSSGIFVAGQTIEGSHIPSGTTITKVLSRSELELSAAVEAGGSGSGVALSASQALVQPRFVAVDNNLASPSHDDVYVSSGEFGDQVVDKFTSSGEFIGQIATLPPVNATGDVEAGSNVVKNVTTSGFVLEGETVTGPGIPPGTKILGCPKNGGSGGCGDEGFNDFILSNPATATTAGASLIAESGHFEWVGGLAVDPAGSLFVLELHGSFGNFNLIDRFDAETNEFQRSCLPLGANAAAASTNIAGLAVDSHDDLYLVNNATQSRGNGAVVEIDSNCHKLNLSLDNEAPDAAYGVSYGGVAVEPSTDDSYVDNLVSVGRFSPTGGELERFGNGHLASEGCNNLEHGLVSCLGGVAVDAATSEVLAAVGKGAHGAHIVVFGPEPPTVPKIESVTVSRVTDTSAVLEAEINPRSVGGEAPTTYSFEYGPCNGGAATCPASPFVSVTESKGLPPSFEVEAASAALEGLDPYVTYHYRLVAKNAHGTVQSGERSFTTFSPGEFALPDGRQWEMVSPSSLEGALIEPLGKGGFADGAVTQAAAAGNGFVFATDVPTESRPAGDSSIQEVYSTRAAAGWSSRDVEIPHAKSTVNGQFLEVPFFSSDLSHAAIEPAGSFLPLSAAASEQTAYVRDNATGSYEPLVTGCPAEGEPCPAAVGALADVEPGTVFGDRDLSGGLCPPAVADCGAVFVDATPDLKHVVLLAHAALVPGAGSRALYEWSAEAPPAQRLQAVSVPPEGEPKPLEDPRLGFRVVGGSERGAISADGRRVFFTAGIHLYMHDAATDKTIRVDTPEPGCTTCGGGTVDPEFQFASAEGDRVFFFDTQKLTANGHEYQRLAHGSGSDLYVCEIKEDACVPQDIAPAGEVLGGVIGASEDGSWVYFAANGALAPGAVSGNCELEAGLATANCGIYAEHLEGGVWGTPRLVASVSGADGEDWNSILTSTVARVSPDGHWLAFMSQRSLTGYDNRDARSGRPDQEVYLYDALSGRLSCASCDPTGARPYGVEFNEDLLPVLGNHSFPAGMWLAATIPAWLQIEEKHATYQPRYLDDTGRLYFDSFDGLVAKDSNGVGDVYQFEPEGQGDCAASATDGSVTYRPARSFEVEGRGGEEAAGCVGLLSSGTSRQESAFLDASESGNDVFFISTARLSTEDVEGGRTIYDAHACSASAPCPPPPPLPAAACEGSACQQLVSPPSDLTPASLTFTGAGNLVSPPVAAVKPRALTRAQKLARALKACRRKPKRKRAACAKRARRAYGPVRKAKGSSRGAKTSRKGAGR